MKQINHIRTLRQTLTSEAKAKEWLINRIRQIRHGGTKAFTPGRMYMFYYEPKGIATLPYYDSFPLALVTDIHGDGFTGLNIHYLPPVMRIALLDKLIKLASDKNYDERTYLRLSYDVLNSTRKYKEFRPCFKKYLYTHLQTKFIPVDMIEWDLAASLPTARFQGASQATVWKESKDKI